MMLVVVGVLLAACWPTFEALHQRWVDTQNLGDTHGYLIAGVSLYLLWRAGREAGSAGDTSTGNSWITLALLLGAGVVWLLGVRSSLEAVQFLMLPILLWLAIRAALGWDVARRSLFPVGYLYFAMPLWGVINPILQAGTVHVVRAMLRIFGIPSHFDGNFVQIPAGTFEIAGGCSGMHFFVVALAIGVLLGQVRRDGWRGRLKLVLLAGTLALVTNWIRVFTIILAGHQTHMQHYLVARSHYGYGWILFSVAMAVFFLVERRMRYAPQEPDPVPTATASLRGWNHGAIATAVVLAFIGVLQLVSARPARAALPAPALPHEWSLSAELPSWEPVVHGADAHLALRLLSAGGDSVDRHEYLFLRQGQGKELGGYFNDFSAGTTVLSASKHYLSGTPVTMYQAQEPDGGLSLIAVSYDAGGRFHSSAAVAQLYHALDSMVRLRSTPATVTVWRTACLPACSDAEQVLVRLLANAEADPRGIP